MSHVAVAFDTRPQSGFAAVHDHATGSETECNLWGDGFMACARLYDHSASVDAVTIRLEDFEAQVADLDLLTPEAREALDHYVRTRIKKWPAKLVST